MSKPNFTPGPWKWTNSGYDDNLCYKVQIGTKDRTVAYAYSPTGDREPIQTANAHLIAAAPDLYAVCEAMQKTCELPDSFAILLNAALKKARGER